MSLEGHGTGPRELVELQRRAVKDIQFGDDFIVILATGKVISSLYTKILRRKIGAYLRSAQYPDDITHPVVIHA